MGKKRWLSGIFLYEKNKNFQELTELVAQIEQDKQNALNYFEKDNILILTLKMFTITSYSLLFDEKSCILINVLKITSTWQVESPTLAR